MGLKQTQNASSKRYWSTNLKIIDIQRQIASEVVTVMLIEVAEETCSSKLLDTTLPLFLCNHSW